MIAAAKPRDDARRLRGVQALRAVAALMVMGAHMQAHEAEIAPDALLPADLTTIGSSGVHLFFLISGFIMVWIAGDAFGGGRRAAVFLYNRVTRIYPPLWLFMLFAVPLILLGGGDPASVTPGNVAASLLLAPQAYPPLLPVAWTLIHEMYFYLVFALFLLGPARLLPLWLAVWAALSALPMLPGWDQQALNPWLQIAVNPLTLEFIAGCVIGLIARRGRMRFGLTALLAGAAGMIACWAVLIGGAFPQFIEGRAIPFYGPWAALILYGVVALERDGRWRPPGTLVTVGDWSYSLYLSHLLVLTVLARLWMEVALPGPADNIAWYAVAGLACLAVAAIAYRAYEKPALRLAARGRARLFGPTALPPRPTAADRIW